MSLLALELNEARKRELALGAIHRVLSATEETPTDERTWPSPAPQLVLVEDDDCVEPLAA